MLEPHEHQTINKVLQLMADIIKTGNGSLSMTHLHILSGKDWVVVSNTAEHAAKERDRLFRANPDLTRSV